MENKRMTLTDAQLELEKHNFLTGTDPKAIKTEPNLNDENIMGCTGSNTLIGIKSRCAGILSF
jgi:hypothetical protein